MLLFPDLILNIRRLIDILATRNELCIRFTSRSSQTPTMSENFSKKYPLREFPSVEILNISSMVFQEIGNGRSKLRITGAIILKSPYYMETTLIGTLVLRLFHLQAAEDMWQLSQTWPGSYWNH
jgi:hypothetical protein